MTFKSMLLLPAVSLIMSSCFMYAQNLSLNDAVNKAIENNFQVKILSNQVEIAELSNTYGNAGGLPLITGNVNQNFTLNNIQQELSSGVTINQKNATGNSFNSNLNAGILVFNGFKVRASKAKFEELVKQNKLILEDEILELRANVNAAYYKVLEAEELQNQYTKNLNLATRKKDLIQARINAGYANEADLLQVQIEWNNLKTIIDLQNTNIATAKRTIDGHGGTSLKSL
ncbi:MAG: TolC family protein [Saprospiraceae bacterium]|nr:TolC family protein [Saprospiraceae bacterium]